MSPTPTPEQDAYGMYIVDLVSGTSSRTLEAHIGLKQLLASAMTFLVYDILLTSDDEV
jgi:hypothetical protein